MKRREFLKGLVIAPAAAIAVKAGINATSDKPTVDIRQAVKDTSDLHGVPLVVADATGDYRQLQVNSNGEFVIDVDPTIGFIKI